MLMARNFYRDLARIDYSDDDLYGDESEDEVDMNQNEDDVVVTMEASTVPVFQASEWPDLEPVSEDQLKEYERPGGRWSFAAPPGVPSLPHVVPPPSFNVHQDPQAPPGSAGHRETEGGNMMDEPMRDDKENAAANQITMDAAGKKPTSIEDYHDVLLHGIAGLKLGHRDGPAAKMQRNIDFVDEFMTPKPIPLDALLDHENPLVVMQRTTTADESARYIIFSDVRSQYNIGREYEAGADYVIENRAISKLHAGLKLMRVKGDVKTQKFLFVKDSSANGTFVNGERLHREKWEMVYPGDIIAFGARQGLPTYVVKSGNDTGVFASNSDGLSTDALSSVAA